MASLPAPLPPISLHVSNQKAYVLDVDDIDTLRSKHHICGTLTGTLPHVAQQNVFLGVPILLMPEEVVLLVEKQFAVLVDDPPSHHPATMHHLQAYNAARIELAQRHIALGEVKEAKAAAEVDWAMSETAIQKRNVREQKRQADAALKAVAEGDPRDGSLFEPTPEAVPKPGEGRSGNPAPVLSNKRTYTITTPSSSNSLGWYSTDGHVYATIAAAKAAGIWSFPASLHERALCGVFRGLWEQGFFMGGGIKFGGDYLVYPGDPLRYHSHFTTTVIDSPVSALRPMEVVAHGRLGTATKKSHLLCGWDDEKQEVTYLSIEWAGFG